MYRFGEYYDRLKEMNGGKPWLGKIEPFKIIGGVYFVGTYQASTHIIDTGDGLIMIDPGYSNGAYLVLNSVYKLGYKPTDIKYIINTHHHYDHVEATMAFADLSGAKTLIGEDDFINAQRYFTADIKIKDGDTLTLGNTTVEFMHTPGHTKGTVSFFFNQTENGKTYRVGSFGGAGVNTLAKNTVEFDGAREAYLNSIDKLKKQKVDVFIGNHTWNNDTFGKAKLIHSGVNPFIDKDLWVKFLDNCKRRLEEVIEKERNSF